MSALYGIYGTGGQGRETLPMLRGQLGGQARIVFIDDHGGQGLVNGTEVLTWEAFLATPAEARLVTLAIGKGAVRERLHQQAQAAGVGFAQVRAANVVVLDDVEIGEGAILAPFVSLTSNIRIGLHFHANTHCSIAHDCVIGDFVTFGPGVRCNGNVTVCDHAYVGSGALIRQGQPGQPLVIGAGAVVGMGAVVTRDVPAGMTVVGNPARPLNKG